MRGTPSVSMCVTAHLISVTLAFYFTSLLINHSNVSPLWTTEHLNTQIDIQDMLLRMFIACIKKRVKDLGFSAWNVLPWPSTPLGSSNMPLALCLVYPMSFHSDGEMQ